VKERKVAREEIRQAYGESLDIVLKEVESLAKSLSGKTVVTADHGEMLGEQVSPVTTRVWGHSEEFSTRLLRKVPWLTIEADERRTITADQPEESADIREDAVSERLEALGYAE
jgi:membrane-anchored protein YejM (alkaline phosphatase superfamily)